MALSLTRKPGERIMIGDDITIEVRGIEQGRVRLSIDAPQEVKILRREVYDIIQRETKADQ